MANINTLEPWDELKKDIEVQTGFACYEGSPNTQTVWYGTSDKFEDFKTLVGNACDTGTIAYLMDTAGKYMYSFYKNAWYEL